MGQINWKVHLECIEHRPSSQSVFFDGFFISLSAIALKTGMSVGGLSYIFSGKYNPSVKSAKKIAKAMGCEVGDFLKALDAHVETQLRYTKRKEIAS